MNYSDNTKNYILDNLGDDKFSNFAFLWAITKCSASIQFYKEGFELVYEIKHENVANTLLFLLKTTFDFELNFEFSTQEPRIYYIKAKGEKVNKVLTQMGLTHYENDNLIYDTGIDRMSALSNREAVRSYVQGIFCSVGSVYLPSDIDSKEGYHLEIILFQEDYSMAVKQLLEDCGIFLNFIERGNSFVIYSKNSETITDFLAFVKAMEAVTYINDIIIRRQINNQINRASNFMVFNTDKTVQANTKYIEAINKIISVKGITSLEDKLRLVAEHRLQDKTESMGDLAIRMGLNKSSLNRALVKLVKIAEEL